MSVAPVMDQLKVEDWPRSIEDGSAVKLLITGRCAAGAGAGGFVTGGGGGGGGTFFLQLAANIDKVSAKTTAPIL
ncbi:MAG TPA: hypothetical protein VEV17_15920 [Bryobacteraceae bacterium]|nr:hypothetical protein [Bryobacteraceae bacterium]